MAIEFITGSMFAGKSRELIDFLVHCEEQEIKALRLKPVSDTRDLLTIKSRDRERTFSCMGIAQLRNPITGEIYDQFPTISKEELESYRVIVVDELQFLTPAGISWLVQLSKSQELPLIMAGLTHDFRGMLFPAVQYLLETYGEEIQVIQLKAKCFSCEELEAVHSCRVSNNKITLQGETNKVGDSESYIALCSSCLERKIDERKGD